MINMREMNQHLLTGLPERWELLSFLDQLTVQSQSRGRKFTAVLIRLEPLKKSDGQHYKFNNELLQYTTSTLRLTLSDGSCKLFHYERDEVMGVFLDADKKDIAGTLLAISENFKRRPFLFGNKLHSVKVKIGVSSYPRDGWQKDDLLRTAAASCAGSRLNKYRLLSWMNKFGLSRAKPVLMSLVCVLFGAMLFFAWSKLDVSALKSSAAKMLLGTTAPSQAQMVKVVTKSGSVFQGFLISETAQDIIVSVILDKGQASLTFSKTELLEILRGKDAF